MATTLIDAWDTAKKMMGVAPESEIQMSLGKEAHFCLACPQYNKSLSFGTSVSDMQASCIGPCHICMNIFEDKEASFILYVEKDGYIDREEIVTRRLDPDSKKSAKSYETVKDDSHKNHN